MKHRILLYAYAGFCILHLVGVWLRHEGLVVFTKPLLLALLAVWFYVSYAQRASAFFKFILAGLFFSIGGDTLLMLVDYGPRQPHYFLLGLGSFLVAQICYTLGFWQRGRGQRGWIQARPWRMLPLLAYLGTMLWVLLPNMDAALRVPVGVYASAITLMVASVVNLKGIIGDRIFYPLLAGVGCFLLSDSLIAINKFYAELPAAGLAIMSTYLLAQYLIATQSERL